MTKTASVKAAAKVSKAQARKDAETATQTAALVLVTRTNESIVLGFDHARHYDTVREKLIALGVATNEIRDGFKLGYVAAKASDSTQPTEEAIAKGKEVWALKGFVALPNVSTEGRRTKVQENWCRAATEAWGSLTRGLIDTGEISGTEEARGRKRGQGAGKSSKGETVLIPGKENPASPDYQIGTPLALAAYQQHALATVLLKTEKEIQHLKAVATFSKVRDALAAAKLAVDELVAELQIERDCAPDHPAKQATAAPVNQQAAGSVH